MPVTGTGTTPPVPVPVPVGIMVLVPVTGTGTGTTPPVPVPISVPAIRGMVFHATMKSLVQTVTNGCTEILDPTVEKTQHIFVILIPSIFLLRSGVGGDLVNKL